MPSKQIVEGVIGVLLVLFMLFIVLGGIVVVLFAEFCRNADKIGIELAVLVFGLFSMAILLTPLAPGSIVDCCGGFVFIQIFHVLLGKSFVEAFREMERQQETSLPDVVVQGFPPLGEKPKPAGPSTGYAAQRVAPTTNLPVMEAAVVEATDSAEVEKLEERLAKQAKELAEQAKIVSERLKSKDGAAAAGCSEAVHIP